MGGTFYGWYFKNQSYTQTFAVIPAAHSTGKRRTCSIQIITDDDAWTVSFSGDVFQKMRHGLSKRISILGAKAVLLKVESSGLYKAV